MDELQITNIYSMSKEQKVTREQTEPLILDLEFLRLVTNGDVEFEHELFDLFLESAKEHVNKLEKSLNDSDLKAWHAICHSFKGSSASMGAIALSQALDQARVRENNKEDRKKILKEIKERVADLSNVLIDLLKQKPE